MEKLINAPLYVKSNLDKVELNDTPSWTYNIVNILKADEINIISELCKTFGLVLTDKQKDLPIMYWLSMMHKKPVGC